MGPTWTRSVSQSGRPVFWALALTILLFTAASVAMVTTLDRAGAHAGRDQAVAQQYDELQVALLQQEVARHDLLVERGSPAPTAAAQRVVLAAFERIKRAELQQQTADGRTHGMHGLEAELMAYHSSVDQMIMMIGKGRLPEALESRTDRQAHLLVDHVSDHSEYYRAEAAAAFTQMRRTQDLAARVFPALGAVALLLAGACLRLMSLHHRRLTALRSEAQTKAVTDELTGLANRAGLRSALQQALPRAAPDRLLGLLLLDLDGFKAVNDTFGHEFGDDVLKVVAERLRNTVPTSALVARLGGDEFVVLLPDAPDQAKVDRVASEVWPALSAPTIVRSVLVDIGASIGIAVTAGSSDDPATTASELLRHADIAMYASKTAQRGPVLFSSVLTGDARPHLAVPAQETR